jgi:hypothetical protein
MQGTVHCVEWLILLTIGNFCDSRVTRRRDEELQKGLLLGRMAIKGNKRGARSILIAYKEGLSTEQTVIKQKVNTAHWCLLCAFGVRLVCVCPLFIYHEAITKPCLVLK